MNADFVGPAALAKAYRFVADPRDGSDSSRLMALNNPGGMWDCTRCLECIEVCPKEVGAMDRIMTLRARGIEQGVPSTCGSRHTEAFADIIEHKGRLDEPMLAVRTFGLGNLGRMFSFLPMVLSEPWSEANFQNPDPCFGRYRGLIESARLFQRAKERP